MSQFNLTSSHSNGSQEYRSDAFSMLDLNRVEKWADRNLMKFNNEKCKILHLERNKKMETGSFLCQVQRQWEQAEIQKVPFEHQETLFCCECWHRWAREVVESPFLEILKSV